MEHSLFHSCFKKKLNFSKLHSNQVVFKLNLSDMKAILELNETELNNKVLEAIKMAFKGLDLEISVQVKNVHVIPADEFASRIKEAQDAVFAYRLSPSDFDGFYDQVMSNEEIHLEKEFAKFRIDLDNERN